MGCSGSKVMKFKPNPSFHLTPAVMRRNIKMEMHQNNGKIRGYKSEIEIYRSKLFQSPLSEKKNCDTSQLLDKIKYCEKKIFA